MCIDKSRRYKRMQIEKKKQKDLKIKTRELNKKTTERKKERKKERKNVYR